MWTTDSYAIDAAKLVAGTDILVMRRGGCSLPRHLSPVYRLRTHDRAGDLRIPRPTKPAGRNPGHDARTARPSKDCRAVPPTGSAQHGKGNWLHLRHASAMTATALKRWGRSGPIAVPGSLGREEGCPVGGHWRVRSAPATICGPACRCPFTACSG